MLFIYELNHQVVHIVDVFLTVHSSRWCYPEEPCPSCDWGTVRYSQMLMDRNKPRFQHLFLQKWWTPPKWCQKETGNLSCVKVRWRFLQVWTFRRLLTRELDVSKMWVWSIWGRKGVSRLRSRFKTFLLSIFTETVSKHQVHLINTLIKLFVTWIPAIFHFSGHLEPESVKSWWRCGAGVSRSRPFRVLDQSRVRLSCQSGRVTVFISSNN